MSLTVENTCAFAKINAYFQSGALPRPKFFCPLEAGPWGMTINGLLLNTGSAGLLQNILEGLKGIF
jgi:hypothetical protein